VLASKADGGRRGRRIGGTYIEGDGESSSLLVLASLIYALQPT
jgi:hypothetical protein